jgi:hypothetical protein
MSPGKIRTEIEKFTLLNECKTNAPIFIHSDIYYFYYDTAIVFKLNMQW